MNDKKDKCDFEKKVYDLETLVGLFDAENKQLRSDLYDTHLELVQLKSKIRELVK